MRRTLGKVADERVAQRKLALQAEDPQNQAPKLSDDWDSEVSELSGDDAPEDPALKEQRKAAKKDGKAFRAAAAAAARQGPAAQATALALSQLADSQELLGRETMGTKARLEAARKRYLHRRHEQELQLEAVKVLREELRQASEAHELGLQHLEEARAELETAKTARKQAKAASQQRKAQAAADAARALGPQAPEPATPQELTSRALAVAERHEAGQVASSEETALLVRFARTVMAAVQLQEPATLQSLLGAPVRAPAPAAHLVEQQWWGVTLR